MHKDQNNFDWGTFSEQCFELDQLKQGEDTSKRQIRKKIKRDFSSVFVGNLGNEATEAEITHFINSTLLQHKGLVPCNVCVVINRRTGRAKGWCYVDLCSQEQRLQAIECLKKVTFKGQELNVAEKR